MRDKFSFTLVEIVIILVILGILAVIAFGKYSDLSVDTRAAAVKGVVAGVRAGIHTYFAQNQAYPATLDNASLGACSIGNVCFNGVLGQSSINSDWTKPSVNTYVGPTGALYIYDPATGDFK